MARDFDEFANDVDKPGEALRVTTLVQGVAPLCDVGTRAVANRSADFRWPTWVRSAFDESAARGTVPRAQ